MANSPATPATPPFLMVGSDPSLDFVNTLIAADDGSPVELLDSPAALLAWGAASGLFDDDALGRFRAAWSSPRAGAAALAGARAFRTELKILIQRVIAAKSHAEPAATVLTPYLDKMPLCRRAVVERGRLRAGLRADEAVGATDEFLGTLANSALELLAQADPDHIRKCANPACVLVFRDTTKNHRRQWCCMAVCGNRAKATRFRAKREEK